MTHVLDSEVAPFVPSHVQVPLTTSKQVGGSWAAQTGPTTNVKEASYEVSTRPVRWDWHRTETGVSACDRTTGIFGFGTDLNDAIQDLVHALIEHRDVLERQDALSPDLVRQLDYLRGLLS